MTVKNIITNRRGNITVRKGVHDHRKVEVFKFVVKLGHGEILISRFIVVTSPVVQEYFGYDKLFYRTMKLSNLVKMDIRFAVTAMEIGYDHPR